MLHRHLARRRHSGHCSLSLPCDHITHIPPLTGERLQRANVRPRHRLVFPLAHLHDLRHRHTRAVQPCCHGHAHRLARQLVNPPAWDQLRAGAPIDLSHERPHPLCHARRARPRVHRIALACHLKVYSRARWPEVPVRYARCARQPCRAMPILLPHHTHLPSASKGTVRSYISPAASSSRLTTSTSRGARSLLLRLSAFTNIAPAGSFSILQ
mmetsp:Transcript_64475/g.192565  ORF Transcript_64475/g.192565 Transcript_64475/m.192565 type:complete len:212 (+) Transcript_64475:965-1600(+)